LLNLTGYNKDGLEFYFEISVLYDSLGLFLNKKEVLIMTDTPVIDLELGKTLIDGNESAAKEMLKTLSDLLPQHQKIIEKAYSIRDFISLADETHKIHGGACYCGTPRLKEASKNLEIALKLNNYDDIDVLYEHLLAEIKAVQDAWVKI